MKTILLLGFLALAACNSSQSNQMPAVNVPDQVMYTSTTVDTCGLPSQFDPSNGQWGFGANNFKYGSITGSFRIMGMNFILWLVVVWLGILNSKESLCLSQFGY